MSYRKKSSKLEIHYHLSLHKRALFITIAVLGSLILSGCATNMEAYNAAVVKSVVDKKQNFLVRAAQQCFPSLRTTSTCHQCCHTNNCNKELDPSDEAGWVRDHEGAEDFLGIYFSDLEEN